VQVIAPVLQGTSMAFPFPIMLPQVTELPWFVILLHEVGLPSQPTQLYTTPTSLSPSRFAQPVLPHGGFWLRPLDPSNQFAMPAYVPAPQLMQELFRESL
jgi:hypothetical protein